MKLININEVCKSFNEKFYNNDFDSIMYDIINFNKKLLLENEEITEYDIIKAYKAISAYCGIKNIDLNKFIKLKIE